jgi:hypothetical protein
MVTLYNLNGTIYLWFSGYKINKTWGVTLCNLEGGYQHFAMACCLHLKAEVSWTGMWNSYIGNVDRLGRSSKQEEHEDWPVGATMIDRMTLLGQWPDNHILKSPCCESLQSSIKQRWSSLPAQRKCSKLTMKSQDNLMILKLCNRNCICDETQEKTLWSWNLFK